MSRRSLLLILILFAAGLLNSQSVTFVRSIDLDHSGRKGKLTEFLFGKKKTHPVKPGSVFRIGELRLGITDQLNSMVWVLNQTGKIEKKITRFSGTPFRSPVGGCGDGRGGFYVSDSGLRAVVHFSESNKYSNDLIKEPSRRITGIAYHDGKIFCADTGNHEIVVLNRNGDILRKIGSRGTGAGRFNFPTHLAVDAQYIYVNDALNFRIQMFDHSGRFVGCFGKNGKRGGDFSKPKGIAVDSKKRIFVTDVMFDNIQVFDVNGRFLSFFGGPGKGRGQFWMPSGIMVDRNDLIYVADTYNSRLQVYRVTGGKK